ncbi:MAG: hypothetical protein GY721_10075 [Deltaproteobacteria bacterium]|nr:hypothetical protein [Deltaproteobacteria bacterium]
MNIKEYLTTLEPRQRSILILGALILIVILWGGFSASSRYTAMKRMVSVKQGELSTFNKLAEGYIEKEARLSALEKRITSATASKSVVAVIEGIAKEIGVKSQVASLLPLKEEIRRGYLERGAEVKIKGIDLNRLINLLYALEHHRSLLLIKEFSLESRFDNRELLDVRLKIVQVSKAPGNRG